MYKQKRFSHFTKLLLAVAICILPIFPAKTNAQTLVPGKPEDNGLKPLSKTIYANVPDSINNNETEALAVAINSSGTMLVGWEDDGNGITDLEAVWSLFDISGNNLTPINEIHSLVYTNDIIQTRFLSLFRPDLTPVPAYTSWGPKLKANLFGTGMGMGVTSFKLESEIPSFTSMAQDAGGKGDFPSVQILTETGTPTGILTGVSESYADRAGSIRIADWDFLSNGNIVIVGESRQKDDLINVYHGQVSDTHAIYRVLTTSGTVVKAESLASEKAEPVEMWHGVGVVKDGFALRFNDLKRSTVRLFKNDGTPASTNIDIGLLTGSEIAAGGGRGEGVGFHGNGKDLYALTSAGSDPEGNSKVFLTVLNADGSLRFSKSVAEDYALVHAERADVGINSDGTMLVVFHDTAPTGGFYPIILGRLFDRDGNPLSNTFYISENEIPDPNTLKAKNARVALRGDKAIVGWESNNSGATSNVTAAFRTFSLPMLLSFSRDQNGINLNWNADGAILQSAPTVLGTWQDVPTTGKSYPIPTKAPGAIFFRLRK